MFLYSVLTFSKKTQN